MFLINVARKDKPSLKLHVLTISIEEFPHKTIHPSGHPLYLSQCSLQIRQKCLLGIGDIKRVIIGFAGVQQENSKLKFNQFAGCDSQLTVASSPLKVEADQTPFAEV